MPFLTRLPAPPPKPMMPPNVVFSLFPPTVSVCAPSVTFPPVVPPPESEPRVKSNPVRSRFTPVVFASVTAVPVGIAVPLPALSVPVLITVGPEYVFVPESVSVVARSGVAMMPPVPVMLPAMVVMFPATAVVFSVAMAPLLSAMLRVAASVCAAPVMLSVPLPLKVTAPVALPRLASAGMLMVPALMTVPPLYVFGTVSVSVPPVPDFTRVTFPPLSVIAPVVKVMALLPVVR